MARVKNSVVTHARRKKVLKNAEGYFGSKHRLYKTAHEQVMHSDRYAYRDRKQKKRDFRKLWITRINAECRNNDISYSMFINGLNKAGIEINRKMLAELAINDKEAFANLVKIAKTGKVTPLVRKAAPKTEEKPVAKKVEKEETKAVKKETKPAAKKDEDLESKTLAELKEIAKAKKLTGYSTMKKADLIAALRK